MLPGLTENQILRKLETYCLSGSLHLVQRSSLYHVVPQQAESKVKVTSDDAGERSDASHGEI